MISELVIGAPYGEFILNLCQTLAVLLPRKPDNAWLGRLPMQALTGRSYAALEIQEGGRTFLELLRVTFGDLAEAEHRRSAAPTISGVLWAA